MLDGDDLRRARAQFHADWDGLHAVALTERTCELAAEYAERLGVRSLDALHLGAAASVAEDDVQFATFDRRLADAARSLGWEVLGA
jgi:predicted nucleic acid-binding protein